MTVEKIENWLRLFDDAIQEQKTYLSELDGPIGDHDHGANMSRGMNHVMEMLESNTYQTPSDILKATAMQLMSKVGGASGALYGSAFLGMAQTINDAGDNWAEALQSGIDMIQKRGKAETGEKTLIDVWVPVQEALSKDELTKQVIEDAVESTKDMKATKGRASYVAERSKGHLDPGSVSSGLLFEAALEAEVF